ncbi:hypothetical protein FDI23_gp073 [Serratia phage CHI14]|uniref:Uncharacterized protein n=2 Tax=Winklervirus chi14 TaxID=2560752 RepID=A0A1Z1LY58_9CAUD|nr:hypothetical protein FDI23_gp073 [Serratia phage CHI14]ARW57496.1 hypothetical protein [Serratia phage CHI14]ARW57771.1 hypothetical protein [Serratia phage CBH8]
MNGSKILVTPVFNTYTARKRLEASYNLLNKYIEPGDELTIIAGRFEDVPGGAYFGAQRVLIDKLNIIIDVKDVEERWALFTDSHIDGCSKCEDPIFLLIK